MPVDIDAAERFVHANARVLERHRLAVVLHGAPSGPACAALRAYRNPDGGFGHALEPDVRAPQSEPTSTLHALEVLDQLKVFDDPMVSEAAAWVAGIAGPDGGVPFVMSTAAWHPHAPWMIPSADGSMLTFAIAARLWDMGSMQPWLRQATHWCWAKLDGIDEPAGYWLKFALQFLDAVPDRARADGAIQQLRDRIGPDGSIPVTGGTENERLSPLALSPRLHSRSRALFTDEQISADLDALEQGQRDDGGWTFDWLAWSPGQSIEWRGILTVLAVITLAEHGRIAV
jgi:hypothetical protein